MADGERSTSGAGGGEESQLAIGGDEQRHPCDGEVRDREEPPLSKKSRKEQKRKKLEKRKRVEEDSRPRETVKTNKMVMAVFAYIYYQSFVMVQDLPVNSVEMILEQILRNLTLEEQHALYEQLGKLLTRGY